jgi:hypothetical protein
MKFAINKKRMGVFSLGELSVNAAASTDNSPKLHPNRHTFYCAGMEKGMIFLKKSKPSQELGV